LTAILPTTQFPGVYRRRVGDFVVTAITDGFLKTEREMTRNLPQAERDEALSAAFRDELVFSINAFLIQRADLTVLLDTGSGNYLGPTAGRLMESMKHAGVEPTEIDAVLLTHMHPDHSAGLTNPATGERLFPRAELVTHENEPKHWFDDAAMSRATDRNKQYHFQATRDQVSPYLDRMRTFKSGEVLPGIMAIPLPGHTPGHTGYLIESGKDRLLIWGDIIHIPEVQFARPEIAMMPDTDPDMGIASRRLALGMAASERMLVAGMHTHFPGFGHVARERDGFRFHPEPWATAL
jgi:glyoxylase-like metal-dependent hydrolase (beta-lactamase superfamily II)